MKKIAFILRECAIRRILLVWAGTVFGVFLTGLCVASERTLPIGDAELPVRVVEAQQPQAVLFWLPSELGLQDAQQNVAEALARRGIETWLVDPFEGWLLPVGESSLMRMPPQGLAQAIEVAARQAKAPLIVVSHDRGSVPALEALHAWQQAHPGDGRVRGALFITPNLFLQTPEPGHPAQLTSVVRQTNLPVFMIQPELSTTALRLPEVLEALAAGGARAYWRIVPDVRDRFFFRLDASAEEVAQAGFLADWMAQGAKRLLREALPIRGVSHDGNRPAVRPEAPRQRGLVRFEGIQQPPALRLNDLDGMGHDLAELRGKVVLVNFWASWCPPCVHEMPSMQKLWADWRGDGLEILAVNLGEKDAAMRAFVARHQLGFPILLDPAKQAAKAWKVYAYPTSFILDRHGLIRLAVAGGIDWGDSEVRTQIRGLLDGKDRAE